MVFQDYTVAANAKCVLEEICENPNVSPKRTACTSGLERVVSDPFETFLLPHIHLIPPSAVHQAGNHIVGPESH